MMSPFARILAVAVALLVGLTPARAQTSDTNSALLQLLLMGQGLHSNDWGAQTNTNLQKVENAIAAATTKSLTGGAVSLTDDEARSAVLVFTGTLGSNATVTVPSRSKAWTIINQTAGAFTLQIKTSGGSAVTVPQNALAARLYYCNGSAIFDVSAAGIPLLTANTILADLGSGTVAATYAQVLTALGLDATSSPSFANLQLKGAAATYRTLAFYSGTTLRWTNFADNVAESGSNAGSDFGIGAYADDGSTYIGTALKFTRSTMAATFGGPVSAPSFTAGGITLTPPANGLRSGVKIEVASTTTATTTAAVLSLIDGSGNVKVFRSLSDTVSTGCSNAVSCMDTGSPGTDRWLQVWAIGKTDGTVKTILTASAAPTPPTLPTGYVYYGRLGALRVNSSAAFVRTVQYDRRTQIALKAATNTTVYPILVAANTGDIVAPTLVAVSVSPCVPPTASTIYLQTAQLGGASNGSVAGPNALSSGSGSYSQPKTLIPFTSNVVYGGFLLEDTNIYAATQSSAQIHCIGWEDNL